MITTTDIVYQNARNVLLHITAEAEASENESDALKLDISNLPSAGQAPNPVPTSVTLMEAWWNTTFNFVRIEWDKAGGDETMLICAGDGYRTFECVGGKHASGGDGTNDLLVTTDGGADGDAYDIVLLLKLEYAD